MTEPPTTKFPYTLWELFEFEGNLAQYCGNTLNPNKPERCIRLRVSKVRASEWERILGKIPWEGGRNWAKGEVSTGGGGRVYVDTTDWRNVDHHVEVPKPKDGRSYTWKWSGSFPHEWVKDYFAMCSDCRKQHNPSCEHCDWCGKAIKPGSGPYCGRNGQCQYNATYPGVAVADDRP